MRQRVIDCQSAPAGQEECTCSRNVCRHWRRIRIDTVELRTCHAGTTTPMAGCFVEPAAFEVLGQRQAIRHAAVSQRRIIDPTLGAAREFLCATGGSDARPDEGGAESVHRRLRNVVAVEALSGALEEECGTPEFTSLDELDGQLSGGWRQCGRGGLGRRHCGATVATELADVSNALSTPCVRRR